MPWRWPSQPGLLRRRPRPTTASACSRETQFSTSGAYFFNHRAHLAQRVIQHRLALAQLRQFPTGGHLCRRVGGGIGEDFLKVANKRVTFRQ
jgi:hypothetical protein